MLLNSLWKAEAGTEMGRGWGESQPGSTREQLCSWDSLKEELDCEGGEGATWEETTGKGTITSAC